MLVEFHPASAHASSKAGDAKRCLVLKKYPLALQIGNVEVSSGDLGF